MHDSPAKIRVVTAQLLSYGAVMSRAEDKENLQGDIPKSLSRELIAWTEEHKGNSKRQCLQAAIELWLKLPDPIKALTLVCDRDSPTFVRLAENIECSLRPLAKLFIEGDRIDARHDFEEIRDMADALNPHAYTHLTGAETEILDRIRRTYGPFRRIGPRKRKNDDDSGGPRAGHPCSITSRTFR